ncbi:hypothetical protein NA57DRAFT_51196 [Rhizodiscina lignyota]|uniref:Uncharacterized protein n=1 Tax=Rhizodiscina lignyota TaxID=1504668 RepID=A0A9P4MB70_9PEZI|nr:hypothetical protein NA57DRAFT_51196 [Rhizodiscina lignyota]
MATGSASKRRQMFDGERMRELWLPGDGPGDSDLDLVANSLSRPGGHPTWRIYASDIPGGIKMGGQMPPARVLLDDKACYDIIASRSFSGHYKGKAWPFDFTQHGGIRAQRPNRGRQAFLSDGVTTATCIKSSSGGAYYFWGENGDPSVKKKRNPNNTSLDPDGEDDDVPESPRSPNPMDILRQDDANYRAAMSALAGGGGESMAVGDFAEDGRSSQSAVPETPESNNLKRRRLDNLTSRPLSAVDKEELEGIRAEWVKAKVECQSLRQRAEQLSAELATAMYARDQLEQERDEAIAKENGTNSRLQNKYRESEEMRLEINKRTQDAKVVSAMLEKTSKELRELKRANEEQGLIYNTAQDVEHLKNERAGLLDLAKAMLRGHNDIKNIIRAAQLANLDYDADANTMSHHIAKMGDARQSTDEEIKTLKAGFMNLGLADLWEELAKELGR